MAYTIPPRLTSILAEATRLSPRRRRSSDGTLGDSAHRAEHSDHNPEDDPGGIVEFIVHAVDVSQSSPGSPYWLSTYGVFDVHAWQRTIAAEYVAATPVVRARRWPWLATGGYMVGFDGRVDVIFDPTYDGQHGTQPHWRQNGAPKAEHNQHGHFSIGHNAASEHDTQPIFTTEDDVTPQDKTDIVAGVVKALGPVVKAQCEAAIADKFSGWDGHEDRDSYLIFKLRELTQSAVPAGH